MTTEIGCTNLTELSQESVGGVGGLQPVALNDWLALTPPPKFPSFDLVPFDTFSRHKRTRGKSGGRGKRGKLPADSTGKSVKVDSIRWCGRKLSNKVNVSHMRVWTHILALNLKEVKFTKFIAVRGILMYFQDTYVYFIIEIELKKQISYLNLLIKVKIL